MAGTMLVIPAMDLSGGECRHTVRGEPGTGPLYAEYSTHPLQLARLWRRENAKSIQIEDCDGYAGRDSTRNTKTILHLVRQIDIPITLLSRFENTEACRFWLDAGVYRIIVSRLARRDPEGVRTLLREYSPSRIVFGIRASDGKVQHDKDVAAERDSAFALFVRELGGMRLVYADVGREGSLAGPNYQALQRIAVESGLRVTAAGGVATVQQLWRLQQLCPYGVDSIVIGRALYENRFACQKIWRLAEAQAESCSDSRRQREHASKE